MKILFLLHGLMLIENFKVSRTFDICESTQIAIICRRSTPSLDQELLHNPLIDRSEVIIRPTGG
jgi:hypothetical protein